MIIARLFSYTRLLERSSARERVRHRVEVARLKRELTEWQNRLLEKTNVRPLYKPEPTPIDPIPRAPIGITEKRDFIKRQQVNGVPTAEDLVEAANRRKSA